VQQWERELPSDQYIVLPLSGGYDSRLLLWCLDNKERVRAFTYGSSAKQHESFEVVVARSVAEKLGVSWEQIQLGYFHRYMDAWYDLYGISTHAHGMYHYEFYEGIRQRIGVPHAFLSGIIGDVWAGAVVPPALSRSGKLSDLSYSHGLRADPTKAGLSPPVCTSEELVGDTRSWTDDARKTIVLMMRCKLMLLSYLMRAPRVFGFSSWTPFLDIDIAAAMLNLPEARRYQRQWQKDFFTKVGLGFEDLRHAASSQNSLNAQALQCHPPAPLDKRVLSDFIDPGYVDWVNRHLSPGFATNLANRVRRTPGLRYVSRKVIGPIATKAAYGAYLSLWPLQRCFAEKTTVRAADL
jgi:hypothetical protein